MNQQFLTKSAIAVMWSNVETTAMKVTMHVLALNSRTLIRKFEKKKTTKVLKGGEAVTATSVGTR